MYDPYTKLANRLVLHVRNTGLKTAELGLGHQIDESLM